MLRPSQYGLKQHPRRSSGHCAGEAEEHEWANRHGSLLQWCLCLACQQSSQLLQDWRCSALAWLVSSPPHSIHSCFSRLRGEGACRKEGMQDCPDRRRVAAADGVKSVHKWHGLAAYYRWLYGQHLRASEPSASDAGAI